MKSTLGQLVSSMAFSQQLFISLADAGGTPLDAHCLANSRGNRAAKAALLAAQAAVKGNDDLFRRETFFYARVPLDFKAERFIDPFCDQQKRKGRNIVNTAAGYITDAGYARVSHMPVPGEEYRVDLISILGPVTFDQCLDQACSEGGVLLGLQGIILAFGAETASFPVVEEDHYVFSVDEEDRLGINEGGDRSAPFLKLYKKESEDQLFGLGGWPVNEAIEHEKCLLFRFVPVF